MIIVGCDYHPRFQQIAFVDFTETGELKEQRLVHREGAEDFTLLWRLRVSECVSVWRPVGTHAGLNDCSQS